MEHIGFAQRTKVPSFRGELQQHIYTEYNGGWLQMENVSGELQMEH